MKKIELSARERNMIVTAFAMPARGKGGLGLADQRKALRVFDVLRLDEVYERRAIADGDWPDTPEAFSVEDADFLYMETVFKAADAWVCSPPITRRLIALAEKLEAAAKAKGEEATR